MFDTVSVTPSFVANVLSILLLLNLAVANAWQLNIRRSENRYLTSLFFITLISSFIDIIFPFVLEIFGRENPMLINVLNSWLYIAVMLASYCWTAFLVIRLRGENRIMHALLLIPAAVGIVLIVINFFTPIVYELTPQLTFNRGDGFYTLLIIGGAYVIFSLVYYEYARQKGGVLKFFPIWCYFLPIAFSYLMETLFPSISVAWCGVSIALAGILSGLQNEVTFRDTLTGLYNRLYLEHLHKKLSLSPAQMYGIMADLNHFKQINDQFGHTVGDDALIQASRIIKSSVGDLGNVCRYGGDEFVIILNTASQETTERCIAAINRSFVEFNVTSGKPYQLSASVGYHAFDPSRQPFEEYIHLIDQRMYEDKQHYYSSHPEHDRRKR